jgi:hypothetical protein
MEAWSVEPVFSVDFVFYFMSQRTTILVIMAVRFVDYCSRCIK